MEGEIGVGKSSTNNQIMYMYCQQRGIDHTKTSFRFGRQVERVTKQCDFRQAGELILMDTPGTNDIQTELSDYTILKMKNEALAS